ncbi:MAG TPA: ASKHA domain-containing protein [Acidimicrobiales bacterium]|nr:ASKHA domain-containing protein [Acidimicrobiales bacterium]
MQLRILPADRWVEAPRTATILQAAEGAGYHLETLCGGRGNCKKCTVRVPGLRGLPKRAEREAFTDAQLAEGYRLACLWRLQPDLEVELVPVEDFASKAFSALERWPAIEVASTVRRWNVRLPPPTLDDQRSDERRLREALEGGEHLRLAFGLLKKLPNVLRDARFQVSVTAVDDVVVEVEPQHLRPPIGVAIDVGTTSVVAMLVNLVTGTAADIGAHSNSQALHGAEVMSRIEHTSSPGGIEQLQREVIGDINRIIAECCQRTAIDPDDIYALTVVGNTTMIHLFLGLPAEHLGASPFAGVVNGPVAVPAEDLGLRVHPRAEVYVLPSVAGFVGADTVGALLATRLDETDRTLAMIDIGTNGEIALTHGGEVYTASAPAGPAFEGGQIRDGMRATTGAIDTVRVLDDGELHYTTVGGAPPRGICGSALVDLCAELWRVGLVDGTGRLLDPDAVRARGGGPAASALARRVTVLGGRRALVVVAADRTATGAPLVLTQQDIRQYQLVKSAIFSGTRVLLAECGIDGDALEDVFLAGSFGSRIDLDSARLTGLVPDLPTERLHYVGNAALEGARMALLNVRYRHAAATLAQRVHHVELSASAAFSAEFMASLDFDHARPPGKRRSLR